MTVFVVRHGATAWSLSGQHTSTTDIPLTERGRRGTQELRPYLSKEFSLVLVSPMQRARETCSLAGLGERATIDSDLLEWNYGWFEGLTTAEIHKEVPGWNIFAMGARAVRLQNRWVHAWIVLSLGHLPFRAMSPSLPMVMSCVCW